MDILIKLLLYMHILGLVIGMGSGMALANVTRLVSHPPTDSGIDKLGALLAQNGNVGLGMLWASGLLLVWLKHGGVGGFDSWFWIKMVFVVILSASVGIGSASYRRARAGDGAAVERVRQTALVSGLSSAIVIFAAIFSFN